MFSDARSLRRTFVDLTMILTLVGACYFVRLAEVPLRGEESRWASVAQEMQRGGDWLVPREQGQPFRSRPPVGSWLIAGATLLHGQTDAVAAPLPAVAAVRVLALPAYGP